MTPANEMTSASPRRLARAAAGDAKAASEARRAATMTPRWSRRRGVLSVFAALAAFGFVGAYIAPTGAALAEPASADTATVYSNAVADAQSFAPLADAAPLALNRSSYDVYVAPKPKPKPVATASKSAWVPPFVAPDPGTAQAIGYTIVVQRGWNDAEFACLTSLWNRESGWRVNAYNAGSGAYGIPQALPGSKMASAGADWQTNPATQINWGLNYIQGRYGSPCGAWAHSQSAGWY